MHVLVHTINTIINRPEGAKASAQGNALSDCRDLNRSSEGASSVIKYIIMPQSLSKVYLHIIFSTKYRRNLIDETIENELFDYLGGVCKRMDSPPVQVGGYQNHVHILCLFSRKISQSKLLEEIKKRSSKWIKMKGIKYADFYWQDGYGVFSVEPNDLDRVIRYIQNQKAHHLKKDFKREFRQFLMAYKIEYDERYLWD